MGTKQFDSATDLITFTRASSSTFLGSNGLIQTATNNTPRIEYNADGTVKGLLIEEARTNLFTYSNDLSNAIWPKFNCTIATNAGASPDGTSNANKFVPSTNTATHYFYVLKDYQAVSGDFSFSAYVASAGYGFATVSVGTHSSGDYYAVVIDLSDGTKTATYSTGVNTDKSCTVEAVGSFYRVTISGDGEKYYIIGASDTGTYTPGPYGHKTFSGDDTSGILVYGAQLEAGAFPTSYIPTTGSTATRAADVASIPTSAFGYNDAAGTVLLNVAFLSTNVSNNAGMDLWKDSSTKISFRKGLFLGNTGGAQWGLAGIGTNSELFAGSFKENNVVQCSNGTLSSVDTSALIPQGIAKLDMSRVDQNSNIFTLNAHIKSIQYYPRRLSNAQLQELTT